MVVHEFGSQNKKQLLFFPGSCEPWEIYEPAVKLLAEKYHVVAITPDGHDPKDHTDFISVEKTVDDTVGWLKAHGITKLDALYGLSFGGGMVIRFLTTQDIPVGKAIIDAGTAPYRFPKWICKLICVRDYFMIKIGRSSIFAMEQAFPPERFSYDPANSKEEYREIQKFLKTFSNKTMWNIFWSANNYAVPHPAPEISSIIQFWVGTDEWKGRFRDLKWTKDYLPQVEVIKIPHMMHGEYVTMYPEKFAAQAIEFFNGD